MSGSTETLWRIHMHIPKGQRKLLLCFNLVAHLQDCVDSNQLLDYCNF